jgi:hypothetical protein
LFIAGVNGTGEKLFSGVNDISDKNVVRISFCLHVKMNVLEKEFYKWDCNPIE